MSQSLKDQLLGLGFKDNPKKQNAQQPKVPAAKPTRKKTNTSTQPRAKSTEEIDLAKAFTLRQKEEQRLREQAEREKQELARLRKVAKEQVAQLLTNQVLNVKDAEIVRHFPYAGKIKRVYVTPEQLSALNAGEFAVVQHMGKFCIVPTAIALQVQSLIPSLLALHCDGTQQEVNEDYTDPKFEVPDDLLW